MRASVANTDMAISVTEMEFDLERNAHLRRFMSYDPTRKNVEIETIIIQKDEEAEEYENEKFYMGYFKWYWGRHGFFKALYSFFGAKLFYGGVN